MNHGSGLGKDTTELAVGADGGDLLCSLRGYAGVLLMPAGMRHLSKELETKQENAHPEADSPGECFLFSHLHQRMIIHAND